MKIRNTVAESGFIYNPLLQSIKFISNHFYLLTVYIFEYQSEGIKIKVPVYSATDTPLAM
jgi:hypothetical protein